MHGAFVSVQDTHQGSFSNLSQAVDGSPKPNYNYCYKDGTLTDVPKVSVPQTQLSPFLGGGGGEGVVHRC